MRGRKLRMLAGCECSGLVRDAFAARGWEAWSADILPSETSTLLHVTAEETHLVSRPVGAPAGHGFHYQGDVRDLFDWYHPVNSKRRQELTMREAPPLWDLFTGFPPCTHLSLAGAVWWKQKRADGRQDEAAAFFMQMIRAPAAHVAVENPRGDMTRRYRAPDQYVQPWWFGDPYVKATGLWLGNLPPLEPDRPVTPTERVATGGGSWRTDQKAGRKGSNRHEDAKGRVNRQRERNRTLPGLARAMAGQWGSYVEEQQ